MRVVGFFAFREHTLPKRIVYIAMPETLTDAMIARMREQWIALHERFDVEPPVMMVLAGVAQILVMDHEQRNAE